MKRFTRIIKLYLMAALVSYIAWVFLSALAMDRNCHETASQTIRLNYLQQRLMLYWGPIISLSWPIWSFPLNLLNMPTPLQVVYFLQSFKKFCDNPFN